MREKSLFFPRIEALLEDFQETLASDETIENREDREAREAWFAELAMVLSMLRVRPTKDKSAQAIFRIGKDAMIHIQSFLGRSTITAVINEIEKNGFTIKNISVIGGGA